MVSSATAAPPATFADFGVGAGRVSAPKGVAVDQASGAVYVADRENRRVDKFDAEGNFLLAWGAGVADGISLTLQTCGPQASPPTSRCFKGAIFDIGTGRLGMVPDAVAVDQASGEVYVVEGEPRRVTKFNPNGAFLLVFGKNVNKAPGTPTPNLCTAAEVASCGGGVAGAGAGEYFTAPRSVIVDSESRVWVGDGSRIVQFNAAGEYLSQAPVPGGANANSFARDSGGNFLAIKPGANERQRVKFTGFAEGDTYTLGNLPAGCAAASTGPIEYVSQFGAEALAQAALDAACGSGNLEAFQAPPEFSVIARGKLTGQNLGQLSCAKATGAGSCSVTTLEDGKAGQIIKLEPTGSPIDTLTQVGTVYSGAPLTLTLDAADNLYVGDAIGDYKFKVFDPAGEQVSQFGAGQVLGSPGGKFGEISAGANAIAVGETAGALYSVSSDADVAQKFSLPEPGPLPANGKAIDVLPTSATLTGTVNPEGNPTTYRFEYSDDESFDQATPEEALPGSGYEDEAVEAQIDQLIPETTYHFRLVATNHCNKAEPAEECTNTEDPTFTTPPAVEVEKQWATQVSAASATFHAELDPLGVPATWWLEYGTDTGYGTATPEQSLGSGFGPVAVQAPISGLSPNTTYHYRFAARDERDGVVYVVHGPDRTVTTQTAGLGFTLADGRAWEMVSPPLKLGGVLVGTRRGLIQAAADGGGLAYLSLAPIEDEPEGNRAFEASSILSKRASGGNWSSKDITPPHGAVVPLPVGELAEYQLFSTNLETGLFLQRDSTPLSPLASERTPYLRENSEPPAFTPLVNPGNVPPGTEFGGDPNENSGPISFSGANHAVSHAVLASSVPLTNGAPANALYEWTAGQLEAVSVLPAGQGGAVSAGVLGSVSLSVRGALSEDGSRVFWTSASPKALYLRDTQADESARLDVVQPGATGTGGANPVFQGASTDGQVAYFTDTHQLTPDASPTGRDLYRCELPAPGPISGCTSLTDITAPPGGEESAEVQGIVPALSEDGSSLYFVARGVLDTQPNSAGESAVSGEPNLYRWSEEGGARFIATLSAEDAPSWGTGLFEGAYRLTAAGSPDGRHLSFMSQQELAGANQPTGGADPAEQVYLYDAATEALHCVSCRPDGGAAQGVVLDPDALQPPLADQKELWSGRLVAATVPEASSQSETPSISLYRPRSTFDSGRTFFNAYDSLVPADTNGGWDVYEWQPIGTGDCTSSSGDSDTARSGPGCVSLLSSGTAKETGFLDASASGDDVFFLTSAQLSVTDRDEELDVYDARVNGIPAVLEPTPECLGETCQPAPQAPSDPTPASASFQGPGNLKPSPKGKCPKGKRAVKKKGKTRCVPKKPKAAKAKRKARR